MHARRVFELFTLIFLCALFLSTIPIALASTQAVLGGGYIDSLLVSPIQLREVTHTSGKSVAIGVDATHQILFVRVISALGVLDANVTVNVGAVNGGYTIGGVSVTNLDATQVLIAGAYRGATNYGDAFFIKFNVNTYAYTIYPVLSTSGASYSIFVGSRIYHYGGLFYYCSLLTYSGAVTTVFFVWSYNPATNAVVKAYVTGALSCDSTAVSELLSFQDINNLNMLYLAFVLDNIGTMKYYSLDLNSPSLTALATQPFASSLLPYGGATYDKAYTAWITQIDAGIYTSGTHYYMWFAWCYSYLSTYPTGIKEVNTILTRMDFNNSITAASLKAIHQNLHISIDESYSVGATFGFNLGYVLDAGLGYPSTIRVFYPNTYNAKYVANVDLGIINFTSFTGTDFDTVAVNRGVDNIDFTWNLVRPAYQIAKNFAYGVSFQESGNPYSYFYTGESMATITYTVTESYTPVDSPLITNKNYVFTWSIYANGVLDNYNDTYRIILDGIEVKPGTVQLGLATMGVTVPLAGTHALYISIYHLGVFKYSNTPINHVWVASGVTPGTGGTPSIGAGYISLMVIWAPIGLLVVLPMFGLALVGGKFAGGTGMVIGMLGGGFIGVVGGTQLLILPGYYLWLYILFMGIALALAITIGRSGGGIT